MENGLESDSSFSVDSNFREKIDTLRVADLSQILKSFGLSTSGNKHQLQSRVIAHCKEQIERLQKGEIERGEVDLVFSTVKEVHMQRVGPTWKKLEAPSPSRRLPAKSTPDSSPAHNENELYALPSHFESGYNSNPFFEFIKTIASVRLRSVRENKGKPFTIRLDLEKEYAGKNYVLQLFCFDLKCNQPIHVWPNAGFELKVNNKTVNIRKAHKKLPDQVADITAYCRVGINSAQIGSQAYMPYVVVVNVMRRCTVDMLFERVLKHKTTTFDDAFSEVKRSFQNKGTDELQEICSKISLRCPLTRSAILTPARATTCNHFQCFELKNYLMMNERIPQWNCPICSKVAMFKDLVVDSYMTKIISSVDGDTSEVIIQPDGTWEQPGNKRKVEQVATTKSVEVLELSDDDSQSASTAEVLQRFYEFAKKEPSEQQPEATVVSEVADNPSAPVPSIPAPVIPASSAPAPRVFSPVPAPVQRQALSLSCYICGSVHNTKRCSRCKKISYCGRECQTKDWDRHKGECFAPTERPAKQQKTSEGYRSSETSSNGNSLGGGGSFIGAPVGSGSFGGAAFGQARSTGGQGSTSDTAIVID